MMSRARARSPSAAAARRSGPSGRVACVPGRPLSSATNSRLPPPRSPMRPSASGVPATRPSAERRASSAPLRTRTFTPQRRSTSATKAGPSSASRTAAVPRTSSRATSISAESATKRGRLASAMRTPSGSSRPSRSSRRPRPHSTFSLKIGTGERLARS